VLRYRRNGRFSELRNSLNAMACARGNGIRLAVAITLSGLVHLWLAGGVTVRAARARNSPRPGGSFPCGLKSGDATGCAVAAAEMRKGGA